MFLVFSARYATTYNSTAYHLTQDKTVKTDYSRKLVRRESSFKHSKRLSSEAFSLLVNQ